MGFRFEPAVWLGLIRAALVLGTAFGLELTEGQTLAIYAVAEALTTAIQRSVVTPNAKL